MVRATLKEADRIARKDVIADADRTPDRDSAAEWIDRHIVDGDHEWQETTISEIADAAGFSRQHIANTLDAYFQPASQAEAPVEMVDLAIRHIDADQSGDGYQDGFQDGWESCLRFLLDHPQILHHYLQLTDDDISPLENIDIPK